MNQVGEVAQPGRDRPRQLVADETSQQSLQVGEVAQLGRIAPVNSLFERFNTSSVGEVAQLGRDRPRQLVAIQE